MISLGNSLGLPRLSPSRAFGLFVAFLLSATVAVFTYTTGRIKQEIIATRLQSAAVQAQLFEDKLTQTLTTTRLILGTVRDQVGDSRIERDQLTPLLYSALRNAPFLRSLSLADESGTIQASSDARNLGSRVAPELFVPQESAADILRFGPSWPGRDFHEEAGGQGVSFLPALLGPISAQEPYFLVAAINPDYFLNHMDSILPRELGTVDVLLGDGRLLFSTQETLRPGGSHPQDLGLADFSETGAGRLDGFRHDGTPALSAWRSVRAFPLLVSVHQDRQVVLHDWEREVEKLAAGLGLGLLLILLPTTLLYRREIRTLALKAEAAAALAASEERYRLTFAAVRDGIWDWDFRSGQIRCDAHWFEILGYPDAAFPVTREKWLSLMHPDDRERVWCQMIEDVGSDRGFTVAYRQLKANGDWLWVESRGKAVSFEMGEPLRVVGTQTDISARVAAEEAVAAAARHRTALLDHIAAGVFLASPDRIILEVSARGAEMFGYHQNELVGQSFRCLHADQESFVRFWPAYEKLMHEGQVREDCAMRCKDGSLRWTSLYGTRLQEGSDEVIWTMLDITYQHQMQEALLASRKRLEVIINQFPGGLLVEDEKRRIVLANQTFCRLFALDEHPEGIMGENFSSCVARIRASFSHPEHFEWQLRELGEGLEPALGRELGLADGRVLERDYQPIVEGERLLGRLWVFWDVTAQKLQERELKRLASVDSLTGLPNRRIFLERLELELARLERYDHKETALLMVDLDHFKQVNDHYGHGVGDEVLRSFGALVQSLLRRTDLAGRMGGEEFAVLLPGTKLEGAVELAERLRQALAGQPLQTTRGELKVTASIGLTLLASPGDDASTALARADQALYRSKDLGRDRVEVLLAGG